MPLSINIEQLLSTGAIESSRIEYKEGWNPNTVSVSRRQNELLQMVGANGNITRTVLAKMPDVSKPTIERDIRYLNAQRVLTYLGSSKQGRWIVNTSVKIEVK